MRGRLDFAKAPNSTTCVQTVLLAGLAITILSAVWFRRAEFPVKTPEGSE
jgi:hypothetical protein